MIYELCGSVHSELLDALIIGAFVESGDRVWIECPLNLPSELQEGNHCAHSTLFWQESAISKIWVMWRGVLECKSWSFSAAWYKLCVSLL
jgi:hypothetical protein